MIKELNQLRIMMNREIEKYLKKRCKSELKWNETLDQEYLEDFKLYEGILEGLAISSKMINDFELYLGKKRD